MTPTYFERNEGKPHLEVVDFTPEHNDGIELTDERKLTDEEVAILRWVIGVSGVEPS